MTPQHRSIIGLEELSVRRNDTIGELIDVCDNFMIRLEEEREKIVSLILPVAILVSASRKVKPQEDPHEILKRYRYHKNPNAENVITLSNLFDLYEYTENIKSMITDGIIPDEQIESYQEALMKKLQEKEDLAQSVNFATLQEIDQAFAGVTNYEGENQ